jgi:glycosyltransferase involved in cell wall biosynthesis
MDTNFVDGDELIIVNDCSTDNTSEVLKNLKEKYPGIILINHNRNKGGAAARNTAVDNAKNDLLFCLDADNVLTPLSIAALKNYLISNNADVASFQQQHFFLKDKSIPEYVWTLPEGEFDNCIYLNGGNTPGQHGNYLFTKQSWLKAKGYAEGSGALDTWTFGLRQAITGAKIVVLKHSFYYHRLDYSNSYWMRDAEANLWSVSEKVTYALFPFYNILDEDFINYMLGKGRYYWFYTLKSRPIKLVKKESKMEFYSKQNKKTRAVAYPGTPVIKRLINKFKTLVNINGSR